MPPERAEIVMCADGFKLGFRDPTNPDLIVCGEQQPFATMDAALDARRRAWNNGVLYLRLMLEGLAHNPTHLKGP